MLAEKLMQGDVENIVNAVLTAARGGDMTAARIVLDRIAPARKGCPVEFDLPAIEEPRDLIATIKAVVSAMAAGELTPDEASAVAAVLEIKRRTIETVGIERRMRHKTYETKNHGRVETRKSRRNSPLRSDAMNGRSRR